MGKQPNSTKPKRPESFGRGKVTPVQIAFIVYRYLCDNNFSETRAAFRNEASSLIANSPIHEAPKSLLSLGEMLDEYICLKEQKVMVEQERVLLEQEKNRVQMLLNGMQNAMNAYNASPRSLAALNKPASNARSVAVPQLNNRTPPPGVSTTMQSTSNAQSLAQPINTNAETGNFSTPVMNVFNRKRKDTITVDAPSAAKRSRGKLSNKKVPLQGQNTLPQSNSAVSYQVVGQPSSATHSSPGSCTPSGLQVQGSSVAKCLFNLHSLPVPTASPVSETPIKTNSSQNDAHITPPDISSVSTRNGEAAPTCYTVISTKRVMVSPTKQMAYIERSQCISPVKTDSDKVSKRDHVRSRLDFGVSDMPGSLDKSLPVEISAFESAKDVDLFDIDFPNLDALGMDFSFTELFSELEIPCEGIDFSYHPPSSHSKDNNASGSSQECKDNQVISELSTVGEVLSEKDMNIQGPDCLNAIKSVTKSVTILSPVKSHQGYLDQEN